MESDTFAKNVSAFCMEKYEQICKGYEEQFPDNLDLQSSSFFFSFMLGIYITDLIAGSSSLGANYNSALLELITDQTKRMIDSSRENDKLPPVDWEAGKDLLNQE